MCFFLSARGLKRWPNLLKGWAGPARGALFYFMEVFEDEDSKD